MTCDGAWTGEMLWPQTLEESRVIDCSQVLAVGTWVHAWLRARPGTTLVAAAAPIKQQLEDAGLSVIWYNHCEELRADSGGVSPSEREMLWS